MGARPRLRPHGRPSHGKGILLAAALALGLVPVLLRVRDGGEGDGGDGTPGLARGPRASSSVRLASTHYPTRPLAPLPRPEPAAAAVAVAMPAEPGSAPGEAPVGTAPALPLEPPEVLVQRLRELHARGPLGAEAERLLEALSRCAEAEPRRTLLAVLGELDPELVAFLYRAFLPVRRPRGIAALADPMIELAVRHPHAAHRAGALRFFETVLWHCGGRMSERQDEALMQCVASLDPREAEEVRAGAAQLLLHYLDRPEVGEAMVGFAAGEEVGADGAARGAVLRALAERGYPDLVPLALRLVETGRTPERRAAAVEALLRVPADELAAHREEVVEIGLHVQALEGNGRLRLPALLALAVAAPERARPLVAQALAGLGEGELKSALARLEAALAGPTTQSSGGEPDDSGLVELVQGALRGLCAAD